ncbi:MAG: hypothetical protein HYR85_02210 [Planctomycetes bacterium]|nr:hypothetical protein [Planctomycetota bacterium]MBI3848406.1 hypothetical protein [Planctomycetota bacterium]
MDRKSAALGLRARSGWATGIVLGGTVAAPEVVLRERIVLADPKLAGSVQPYHAIVSRSLRDAEAQLARYRGSSEVLARDAVASLVKRAAAAGHAPASSCILRSSGRPLPDLAAILRSHPTVHTAEGEFFRDALRDASEREGLDVFGVKEKEAWERATADLAIPLATLQERIAEMGRAVGRPWRADEKLATLAAWLAMRWQRDATSRD